MTAFDVVPWVIEAPPPRRYFPPEHDAVAVKSVPAGALTAFDTAVPETRVEPLGPAGPCAPVGDCQEFCA